MSEKDNNLTTIEEDDDLETLIKNFTKPFVNWLQVITGVAISDHKELLVSGSSLLGSVLQNEAREEFKEQFKFYQSKSPFKRKVSSKKVKSILYELLKTIDEGPENSDKIQAMQSIFFHSIAEKATEQDEIEAYQLTQLCKQLDSGQILLLQTFYEISQGKNPPDIKIESKGYNYRNWVDIAAKHQGHNLSELVRNNADKLLELNILNKDLLINTASNFNSPITQLGFRLCKLINEYPKMNLESNS